MNVPPPSFRKSRRDYPESRSINDFLQNIFAGLLYSALIFSALISPAHADSCPTPEEIRDRKISKIYDWAVEENTTLKQLLSVQTLYAVRIMDFDSHISCRYTTDKWPVILDGIPVEDKCIVKPEAGEWTSTDSGELVCREEDVTKCMFNLECKKETD